MNPRESAIDGQRQSAGGQRLRSALIVVVAIGGSIAALVLLMNAIAPDLGNTELSGHGTTAMVLGIVFSLIVGIGLMGLVFYSSRRGYDERASGRDHLR